MASNVQSTNDRQPEHLPLPIPGVPDNVTLSADESDRVNLIATEASLVALLRMIADHHRLNLVIAPGIDAPVTIRIRDAELHEVLDAIVHIAGYHWHRSGNLLYVTGSTATGDPRLQGRVVNVYPLDNVRAIDVRTAVLIPDGGGLIIGGLIVALLTHVVQDYHCGSPRLQAQRDLHTTLPDYAVDGLKLDGLKLDGLELDGLELDGLELEGLEIEGLEIQGSELSATQSGGSEVAPWAVQADGHSVIEADVK